MNDWFSKIVERGTHKKWQNSIVSFNVPTERWLEETGLIVEAFFHARYFLEMAVRYGKELKRPPEMLPSGWAALLYLYNLR